MHPLHYVYVAHMPTVELAYSETLKALMTTIEQTDVVRHEDILETALIQSLILKRSPAVLSAIIELIVDYEAPQTQIVTPTPAPRLQAPRRKMPRRKTPTVRPATTKLERRETLAAHFRAHGFNATVKES